MTRFDGKIALITGGTSGMGLATARRLLAEGAQVVITGRSQSRLDAAVEELGVVGVPGDVANLDDLDTLTAGRFGTAEDVASAVAFLASDEASYITART